MLEQSAAPWREVIVAGTSIQPSAAMFLFTWTTRSGPEDWGIDAPIAPGLLTQYGAHFGDQVPPIQAKYWRMPIWVGPAIDASTSTAAAGIGVSCVTWKRYWRSTEPSSPLGSPPISGMVSVKASPRRW